MALGQVRVDLIAQAGKFISDTARARRQFNSELRRMERDAKRTGVNIGKSLVGGFIGAAGITAILRGATRQATDFEAAMREVSTLLSDTRPVEGMTKSVRALSREFGKSQIDNAKALYQIISAGATDAVEAIDILRASNRLAVGGITEVKVAADGLTSILNAYGGAAGTATDVSDALFVAMRAGKTTIGELAANIGQVAKFAEVAGVSLHELLAAGAALTLGGISTAEAFTQIRSVLTAVAKQSKESQDQAKALGIDFSLAGVRAKGFAGFLAEIAEKAGDNDQALANLFGRVEGLMGVLALAGGEQGKAFTDTLEAMGMKAGETELAFAKMSESAQFAMDRASAAVADLGIDLGNALLTEIRPALIAFADNIEEVSASIRLGTKLVIGYLLIVKGIPLAYNLATAAGWRMIAMMTAQNAGIVASIRQVGLLRAASGLLFAAWAGWEIGAALREKFTVVRVIAAELIGDLMEGWALVKGSAEIAWEGIKSIVTSTLNDLREAWAQFLVNLANVALLSGFRDQAYELAGMADEMRQVVTTSESFADAQARIQEETRQEQERIRSIVKDMIDYEEATDAAGDVSGTTAASIEQLGDTARGAAADTEDLTDAVEDFHEWLTKTRAELAGPLAVAQLQHAKLLAEFSKLFHSGAINLAEFAEAQELLDRILSDAASGPMKEYREQIQRLIADVESFTVDPMVAMMSQLEAALETFGDDPQMVAAIEHAMESLSREMEGLNKEAATFGEILERNASIAAHGFRSLQTMAREGSDAYRALQVAIDAANAVAAVGAVLNQGSGDPYTAFARMAAMAAAVAALGYSVGGLAGGFSDVAGQRQQIQGTGTVLGDPAAKSESILRAVEITASATEELVGINKGMLRALQNLEGGLEGAVTFLARGAGGAEFAPFELPGIFNSGIFRFGLIGSLLGGSSEVVDQGIAIFGGTISDIIGRGLIQAFQQTDYRTWLFGSRRSREDLLGLDQGTVDQFNLILTSLADAVRAGAEALGLSAGEIDQAIERFRIAEQRISLMGLTPEEQERELIAVFSAIFDDLAASVVPFIGQFQRAGEGLGETLIRVATEVQVTQEAIDQLGLIVGNLNPEQFAQMADALVEASGGLEEFIGGLQAFVRHFAPESRQFEIAQSELNRAFAELGLRLPPTRDAMWDLMQTLDATTEEGREQIAMLLGLADTADAYYSALERVRQEQDSLQRQLLSTLGDTEALRQMELEGLHESNRAIQERIWMLEDERARVEALIALNDMLRDLFLQTVDNTGYLRRFDDIHRAEQRAIQDANDLAIAAGRAGASERELVLIERWAVSQRAAAIRDLRRTIQDLITDLFGTPLDAIEAQIARLETQQSDAQSALDQVNSELRRTFEAWQAGLVNIQQFLDSMLLGPLSPLTPAQQLAEAQRQFDELVGRARGGDVEALQGLPGAAQALLEIGRDFWASGDAYQALFGSVRDALDSVGLAEGPTEISNAVTQITSELWRLHGERNRILEEQDAADRAWRGMDLAHHLAVLAFRTGIPIAQLAEDLGLDLEDLADALGTDLGGLNLLLAKLESAAGKDQGMLIALEQSNRDAITQLEMIEANTRAWLDEIRAWQPVSPRQSQPDYNPSPIPDLPPSRVSPDRGGTRPASNVEVTYRLEKIEAAIIAGNQSVSAELRRNTDVMEKRRGLG